MRVPIIILLILLCSNAFSQTFINRSGPANTVIDARLGASQNFYLPRLTDTTLSGGKDSIGNLIYDRLRAKIAIRDTVLTGGHKFTFLFKEDDTLATLATKYDVFINTLALNLQQVTDNGNKTTDTIIAGAIQTQLIMGDTTNQDDFEIDVFPDIQGYTGNSGTRIPPMDSMFNWVVRNRNTENIRALLQVGDITNVEGDPVELFRADTQFAKLDVYNMPYLPVIGNHDYFHPYLRDASTYNTYFGPSRYTGKSFYGDCMDGSNENFFILFEGGGHKYAAVGLEFLARDTALNWAQKIIDSLTDREIILVTHAYLGRSGEQATDTSRNGSIVEYSMAEGNTGSQMWEKLVKKNKRIFLVVSGHFIEGSGIQRPIVKRATNPGVNGNTVYQIVCNYQQDTLSGNGYFMRMKFKPRENKITVSFYSPYLGYNDARFASYDLKYPGISMEGAVAISDEGGGLSVAGEAVFDSSVKMNSLPANRVIKTGIISKLEPSQITDDGTNVTINGSVTVPGLASGSTTPTTDGVTKVLVSDANGKLSFRDSTVAVGNSYIKNQYAAAQTADYRILGKAVISENGEYKDVVNIPSRLFIGQTATYWGLTIGRAATGTTPAVLSFYKTRSTSFSTPTQPNVGDPVGAIAWNTVTSTGTDNQMASIEGYVRQVNATTVSGELGFWTRNLAGTYAEKMHITTEGDLRLGGTSTTLYKFHQQSGDAYFAGNTYHIGSVRIGAISPTARLHLPAGTATASTAPLKFMTGTHLTTPEDGAVEYDGVHYYGTIGSTRYQLDQQGGADGNGIYGGSGALPSDVTVTGGANGLTFTSTRTVTNSTVNIDNTSSGRGLSASSVSGIGFHGSSTNSVGILGISTNSVGVWAEATASHALYALSPYIDGAGLFVSSPATTNTVNTILSLTRVSTSAGANNIGGSIDFKINNTTGAGSVTLANQLISQLTTATAASEVSRLTIKGVNTGSATTVATFDGNGNATFGTTNSIVGTATNNNAVAGNIGEYVESVVASGSAVPLATTTTSNVTSISLTAGDWDVSGVVDYAMTAATATNFSHGISATSATLGGQDSYAQKPFAFAGSSATLGDNTPVVRISLASTTTVYLVAQATFSGGSIDAYGTIRARRVR